MKVKKFFNYFHQINLCQMKIVNVCFKKITSEIIKIKSYRINSKNFLKIMCLQKMYLLVKIIKSKKIKIKIYYLILIKK
jgi:hypothetical protein